MLMVIVFAEYQQPTRNLYFVGTESAVEKYVGYFMRYMNTEFRPNPD